MANKGTLQQRVKGLEEQNAELANTVESQGRRIEELEKKVADLVHQVKH